ncbi:hypothetical protein WR25_26095 isoform B [Diploscapter pachys]|uniref:Uncharacterized protein n=1 Tax=Diploscapter pachys TaxID=2018661 RepID=A0A2A2J5Q4_9BILA|nr:hypothetical protein WR25_26095 isoform A [Diploscapter pachys]PAV57017.1 hypothetical protein WR25_26095 isoform B [Diploscapter pachys]
MYIESLKARKQRQRAETGDKGEVFWIPTSTDPNAILRPMSPTICSEPSYKDVLKGNVPDIEAPPITEVNIAEIVENIP